MKIKVRSKIQGTCFTRAQLEDIAASLCVSPTDPRAREVIFCATPPADTCAWWQETGPCGVPIGKIKRFDTTQGVWA